MDWPRAKNILIIAFLGVNLLLGYRLWSGPGGPNSSLYRVTAQEVREVAAQLRDRGITLVGEVPRWARPLPFLTVENPETDARELVSRFLGPGAVLAYEGEVVVARRGQEFLRVSPTGELRYRRELPGSPLPPLPRQAVEVAKEFWRERSGLPGMELDYQTPAGTCQLVVFTQKVQGLPFFGSRAVALVDGRGVQEAYAAWPRPLKPSGAPRPILPATEALLRAAPLLVRGQGAVVVGVEAGYFSLMYDARQWEAVPVWRLRLGNGDLVYVNAYTGEVEVVSGPLPSYGQEMPVLMPKDASRAR